jgi:peptide/nickel transport system permease protein
MLRYAFRRLLWTLPTLIGISIVSFFFLSYVPDPTDDPAVVASTPAASIARARKERFLDLPRFVNLAPRDVVALSSAAMGAVARDGEGADEGRRELSRLGGAALPHVLPALDALPPEQRVRVALALAPVARRMRIGTSGAIEDPQRAVAFWVRFWEDRGIEFRRASVRSDVARLMRYRSAGSSDDLRELDTFALDELFQALPNPEDNASLDRARTLVNIAADILGSDDRIHPGDPVDSAQACVGRWLAFWNVYRSDFVTFRGASRVSAMLLETRYGKWALGAITHRFGKSSTGRPVLDEFARRAPLTISLVLGAILLAYTTAIPLGAVAALRQGKKSDVAIACSVFGLYAIPTAIFATVLAKILTPGSNRLLLGVAILALGLLAAPTRQQRSALMRAMSQEHTRAALARGASQTRVVLVHALRVAMIPMITLGSLEAPMALGGAFVIERVFGLAGVGELTIVAVQVRDTSWLMAISIVAAAIAALVMMANDLGYALLDPRLTSSIFRRGRS